MSRKRSREIQGKDDFRMLLATALTSDQAFWGVSCGIAFAELRAADMWGLPDVTDESTAPRYTDVPWECGSWEYARSQVARHAQSPIESKALLSFLLLAQIRRYYVHVTEPMPDFLGQIVDLRALPMAADEDALEHGLHITPQAGIPSLGIRVDCVFWMWGGLHRPLVVEFDGYEWHKDNFTSDRQRDRDLQLLGFDVARFSGKEINADPVATAIHLDELVRRTQGMKGYGE